MEKNIFLVGVRYLSLFCLLLSLLIVHQALPLMLVLILLVIVINNQIRFFSLQKQSWIFISLFIEVIALTVVQHKFGGIIAFYFIPAILDSTLLLSKFRSYVLTTMTFVLAGSLLYFDFNMEQLSVFISLTMITGLCCYIKSEQSKKLDAQMLYDELSISQSDLKKANEELE
ncbi:MAG: hypothetical protein ACRCS6_00840, partial [Turicibacter sp.]